MHEKNKILATSVSIITVITVFTYSIGQASIAGTLEYFKIAEDMYTLDLIPALWEGGMVITLLITPYLSIAMIAASLLYGISFIIKKPPFSKMVLLNSTYIYISKLYNNTLDDIHKESINNKKFLLFRNFLVTLIILVLYFSCITKSIEQGKEQAKKTESHFYKNENLIQISLEGEKLPLTGVEIYSGPTFISFLTVDGVLTTNKNSIKKIVNTQNSKSMNIGKSCNFIGK